MSTPPPSFEEERLRLEEVARLASRGEEGVARLVELLGDPSWVLRRAVIAALGGLGSVAVEPLARSLEGRRGDEARIAATVDALVACGGELTPRLEQMARHPNPAVVADAAQILGRRREAGATPLLIALVRHADDNVAVAAVEALGRIGGRAAVSGLLDAVQSGNFFRVFPALDVLGRSGDPRAVPALTALLQAPHYQLEAARALGRTGEKGALAPLVALLGTSSDSVVRLAAVSLSELLDRHQERHGTLEGVEAQIAPLAPKGTVGRLTRGLSGAELPEQVAICRVLGALGDPAAAPALGRLLDGSPAASQAAADALRRLGQASDDFLLESLQQAQGAQRKAILPIIRRTRATDEVLRCLSDPDPDVRALACDALARIGNPAPVGALFPLLADPNAHVVQAAIAAIQSLGSDEVERQAHQAVRSESAAIRRSALRILAYFGYSSALELFIQALHDEDFPARQSAMQGLSFLEDPRALDALISVSRDPDPAMRSGAFRALGNVAAPFRVAGALLKGLKDADPWVRYYACQSLGRIHYAPAAEAVIPLLHDPAGQVRVAAVEALSHLRSENASRALRAAAETDDEDVRRAALIGLGLGKREEDLPLLLAAAEDADAATRLVAISAISGFGHPRVLGTLLRAAQDPDENVRTAAIGFLSARRGVEATRALVELLLRPTLREPVVAALAVSAEGRIEGLLAALETADDELAPLLTSSLARLTRADATLALFRALELENPAARKAAASSIAAVGARAGLEALRRHAEGDPDPEVRRICALLLSH